MQTPYKLFLDDVTLFKNFMEPSENDSFHEFLGNLRLSLQNLPSDFEIEALFEKSNSKINLNKQIKKWSTVEKFLLVWTVFFYSKINKINVEEMAKEHWFKIGQIMSKEAIQCIFKFHGLFFHQIQTKEWIVDEDLLLFHIVSIKQKKSKKVKWIDVAKEFYEKSNCLVFRNEKACRDHWISHLDPTLIKTAWTPKEDLLLLKGFQIYQRKWSQIAGRLKGRSIYSIKNRFYSLCTKFDIEKDNTTINEDIENILLGINSLKKMHLKEKDCIHFKIDNVKTNFNISQSSLEFKPINQSNMQNSSSDYYMINNQIYQNNFFLEDYPFQICSDSIASRKNPIFFNSNQNSSENYSISTEESQFNQIFRNQNERKNFFSNNMNNIQ